MNGLSADDYRTTAETLRRHAGDSKEIELYERLARDAKAREDYAEMLGKLGRRAFSESPISSGTRTVIKLLEDGWIPPEGLF